MRSLLRQFGKATRKSVAVLTISAAMFTALITAEGFTDRAVIPTKGDVPTVGHGSTVWENGAPVRMGDTITPERAKKLALSHIQKDELRIKRCLKPNVQVSQAEWDILVDFAYQYGIGTACNSSMIARLNEGKYIASCEAYTLYKKSAGYDCSTLINGRRNKVCWGVWERSVNRRTKCLEAQ